MEFLLLCFDTFAILLLLWGIIRSQKKEDHEGSLGLLMYRDQEPEATNKGDSADA